MIKSLIRRLFLSERKRKEIIKNLKTNPDFRTKDEFQHGINSNRSSESKLKKGEVQSVILPDLGNQKGLTLTKWYFKPGAIVTYGDIICDMENETIFMELETVFSGKLIYSCKLNERLNNGAEIFRIEGI